MKGILWIKPTRYGEQRIELVNELIATIAKQERGFFYNKNRNLTAHFDINAKGTLMYCDDQTGTRRSIRVSVDANQLNKWCGHGHTLRSQIALFAKFIDKGEKQSLLTRYWGISLKSQVDILRKAEQVGFVKEGQKHFFWDYDLNTEVEITLEN